MIGLTGWAVPFFFPSPFSVLSSLRFAIMDTQRHAHHPGQHARLDLVVREW